MTCVLMRQNVPAQVVIALRFLVNFLQKSGGVKYIILGIESFCKKPNQVDQSHIY